MAITAQDQALFQKACEKVINVQREKNGIGTLKEKTMHAVFKEFYEPDLDHQEIPIGSFVADIFRDEEIIEIQTRSLNKLRSKLDFFLEQYPVTIVHPLVCTKWMAWIDQETGEVTNKRKSPKKGTIYDVFFELYKIKMFLNHPGLTLCFPLVNVEEYRVLNGWSKDRKRGSTRYDRIPKELVDEYVIQDINDYAQLIPPGLPEEFTVKDFAKAAKIAPRYAGTGTNILAHVGAIALVGKQGNAHVYRVTI